MIKKILVGAGIVMVIVLVTEIIALLAMKGSIASYAEYWKAQAQVVRPVQTTDVRPKAEFIYVALGDSAAQGIGATSPARGYVGLITRQIEQRTGKPVRVINLSVSGAKVQDVLDNQLPQLERYGAKDFANVGLVTMEIGANNLLDYDAESFKTSYDKILSRLPADRTVVSDMPYFGGRIDAHGNDVAASKSIESVARKYTIPVAPLYAGLRDNHSLRIYAADYFHPSNYGYTIWYDAFWSKIEPKLEN